VIPGPPITEDVKVKLSEGRRYYWEPELKEWVAILTAAEVRELGRQARDALAAPELELADDYERNEHG
jgi:hypothetical protein